jgi:hypothetical protein
MKKSKGLFYAGIAGIIAVLVIAVVVVTMGKRGTQGGESGAGITRITCYGGSEKEEIANDPEVKKIFADKYGIEVNYIAKGSYNQVQIPPEELKADKIDCLWPNKVEGTPQTYFDEDVEAMRCAAETTTTIQTIHDSLVFTNVSGNIWVASANIGMADASTMNTITGTKTLSDVLDRIRITTVNGTDTFDAGSINILYE